MTPVPGERHAEKGTQRAVMKLRQKNVKGKRVRRLASGAMNGIVNTARTTEGPIGEPE